MLRMKSEWKSGRKPRARFLSLASLFAVTLILSGLQSQAQAQVVPYSSLGFDAQFNPGTGEYSGSGIGTHTGKQVIDGAAETDGVFFPSPDIFFTGTFVGVNVVTAANGDTIEMTMSGPVELDFDPATGLSTGLWFPTFTVTGGTGRFANASGTLTGVAFNPPFDPFTSPMWAFDWFIEGKINLGKKK